MEDDLIRGKQEYEEKRYMLEETMQKELEEMKSKNQEV